MRNKYEDAVKNFYNSRKDYDNERTIERARKLVNFFPPQIGSNSIDFATGTGNVALLLAQLVGEEGKIIALDIATSLLDIAKTKVEASGLKNIEFVESNINDFILGNEILDNAYCSFAIVLFENIDLFLARVHKSLKPRGYFAFSSNSDSSYFNQFILEAGRLEGIEIPKIHLKLASKESIQRTLAKADFDAVEIHEVQCGKTISLAEAKSKWNGRFWLHPENPLDSIAETVTSRLKTRYDRIIEMNSSDGEIWFEELIYYVKANK